MSSVANLFATKNKHNSLLTTLISFHIRCKAALEDYVQRNNDDPFNIVLWYNDDTFNIV